MTDELLNQEQVELRMYHGGIKRAENMMAAAEEKGRADSNPYGQELLRRFVQPVIERIQAACTGGKPGQYAAHATLLQPLDAAAVAVLAVRVAVNKLLAEPEASLRQLASSLGFTVHSELVLVQIEAKMPELYQTLVRDLGRRLSKSERHRMAAMRAAARNAGIEFVEWPVHAAHQVGMFLAGLLEDVGLITIAEQATDKRIPRDVALADEVIEQITKIKAFVAISMPTYGPCVEPPRDWTTFFDGGFHTRELRRAHSCLVRAASMGSLRHLYREAQAPVVLGAVNALQRTAWQVNSRVLDAIYAIGKEFNTKELVAQDGLPKPERAAWMDTVEPGAMTEAQALEFRKWKSSMAEWYTQRKLMGARVGRFYSATRAAEMFRAYPAIHFTYFADNRGRLYPMTYGLNPQGSDMQKAMLRFSRGCSVRSDDALQWFLIQGANKWGFDKATLDERAQWALQRQDQIMAMAHDPVANRDWTLASDPMQFLAWAFEFTDWATDRVNFRSHLPISMDGSCNGLQNLSALFRDEIGGAATNLVPAAKMADVYREVADATAAMLTQMPNDDKNIVGRWRNAEVARGWVKRTVMTVPYGVTYRTATQYIIDEVLRPGLMQGFEKHEYREAAEVFTKVMWQAIAQVVVKARAAMDWLKAGARSIIKTLPADAEPIITWSTPSGFPASQAYFEAELLSVRTRLKGESRIRVAQETDDPDKSKHASGLAPNFVHSMDAAHLHLVAAEASQQGIDALAMIHDDYGAHADNAQLLYRIIREQFVSMYESHDPIRELEEKYPAMPPSPARGSLDIRLVLDSPYFFS